MSWTRRETPHEEFTEQATNTAVAVTHPRWRLDIWEVADGEFKKLILGFIVSLHDLFCLGEEY